MSADPQARALFFLQRRDFGRALEAAMAGRAEAPWSTVLMGLQAHALTGLGRHAEAVAAAEELVAEAPDDWWSHSVHTDVLRAASRPYEALAAAEGGLAIAPDLADAWAAVALARLGVDDRTGALAAADAALAIDPECDDGALARGLALLEGGRTGPARAAFREILARDPEDTRAHAALSAADLLSLRFREADRGARASLAIDADDVVLRRLHLEALKAQTAPGRVLYAWAALLARIPAWAGWLLMAGLWLMIQILVHTSLHERIGDLATGVIVIVWLSFCVLTWVGPGLIDRRLRGDPATTHLYDDLPEDP